MNKVIKAILIIAALAGVIGAVAYFTKGFTTFNFSEIKDEISSKNDEKKNVALFNFKSEYNDELTTDNFIDYLNDKKIQSKTVFDSVALVHFDDSEDVSPCFNNVFHNNNLGLQLSTLSESGYFSVKCVSTYKFNHLKIQASNYYEKDDDSPNYIKDTNGSKLVINGQSLELPSNADLTKADETITKTFTFTDDQKVLTMLGPKGRPCVLNLELWSE